MSKAIEPIEQQELTFNGDELIAVRVEDGMVYVPLRPLVERMGLSWPSQRNRINRDEILSDVSTVVFVTNTTEGATKTQTNKMLALPLDYINGFLFGINASRVRDDVRPKLLQYQRDCYRVLYEAFTLKKPTIAPDEAIDAIIATDPHLSEAYSMAQVALQLIRSQAQLRIDVNDHETRLQLLEADSGNTDRYVTNSQASEISQAVKAVGLALGKHSGRNEFGGVYGEVYRRFGITSYKLLPVAKFSECMTFLNGWHQTLTDDSGAEF